jgi:hypothetical protein
LGCKRGTITTYWKRIFRKTECHAQREVMAKLLRFGLERTPKVSSVFSLHPTGGPGSSSNVPGDKVGGAGR